MLANEMPQIAKNTPLIIKKEPLEICSASAKGCMKAMGKTRKRQSIEVIAWKSTRLFVKKYPIVIQKIMLLPGPTIATRPNIYK